MRDLKMPFSRELIKRLTYAKQIYLHGYEHGKNPGYLNKSFAIISLDGAIEHFLWTIIAEFNAISKLPKRSQFHDILATADSAVGNILSLKAEVQKIHSIRNAAQHQGTVPSDRDIESSIVYTEDFLSQACQACFKVKFDEIYLSDLILDPELRNSLRKVENYLAKKDYENAQKGAALTFDMIKNKYKQFYKDYGFQRGPFFKLDFIFSIFDWGDSSPKTKSKRQTLEKILDSLLNEIDRINDRIDVVSLGANVQDYLFFRKNTPRAILSTRGYRFVSPEQIEYDEKKSIRIFNFLYNMIIQWESLKG